MRAPCGRPKRAACGFVCGSIERGAAPRSCGGASQSAGHGRKNPQFQPHILFSSRRKENVPLTVQEKRAAGGAIPLWRTPPDPLLSAPRTDAFSLPQVVSVAPAGGAGLFRLLGRQGSGGFLPLRGGPPARFGDFPAVESHAGVRGRSAPKLSAGALGPRWRSAPKLPADAFRCKPPQAALGPRCRSAPEIPTGAPRIAPARCNSRQFVLC